MSKNKKSPRSQFVELGNARANQSAKFNLYAERYTSIEEAIRQDAYKSKLSYPSRGDFTYTETFKPKFGDPIHHKSIDETSYKAALAAYRADDARLREQFKVDAIRSVGLTNHPKAEKAWSFAWDEGHANGYHDVLHHLDLAADLVKD